MDTLFLDALKVDKDRIRHRQFDVFFRSIVSIEYRTYDAIRRQDYINGEAWTSASLILHVKGGRQYQVRQQRSPFDSGRHHDDALWRVKEILSEATFSSRLNLYEESLILDNCLNIGNHRLNSDGDLFLRKIRLGNMRDGSFMLLLRPFDLIMTKKAKSASERIGDAFLGERYRIDLSRDRDCILHLLKRHLGLVWREELPYRAQGTEHNTFVQALMALGVHVCSADGEVDPAELVAFRSHFRLDRDAEPASRYTFGEAGRDRRRIAELAQDLIDQLDGYDRPLLEHIVVGSALAAAADGGYRPKEHAVIAELATAFGIIGEELDDLLLKVGLHNPARQPALGGEPRRPRAHRQSSVLWCWQGEEAERHLAVLNLSSGASFQDIKSAYRQLVRRLHPDQMKADGASADQIRRNEDALKTINLSYSWLQQRRVSA